MNLRDSKGDQAAPKRLDSQKGFTLVEMAIVLVIIGLIVGGILKGQEIVNNARVKTQVAQVDAVKAAVQTFTDKYGYYPGDDPQASTQLGIDASFAGNGDGFVSSTAGVADADNTTLSATSEPGMVWYELQASNLISGVLSSSPTGTQTTTNTYNYLGKVAGSYLNYADFTVSIGTGSAIANKMVQISGVNSITSPTPVLREQDAYQIDLKYDDGIPYSGQITSSSYSTTNCCKGNSCTSAGSAYGLSGTANSAGAYCALLWVTQ